MFNLWLFGVLVLAMIACIIEMIVQTKQHKKRKRT